MDRELGWLGRLIRDLGPCSPQPPVDHDQLMKKVLVAVALLVGLGVLAQRLGQKMSNIDWEERFDRMPDNAPPKWMNTDRILEILDPDSSRSGNSTSSIT